MTSRLASLLTQEGLVSAKKIAEAFQRQVIYGGTLDTILLEMDVIDEPTLLDAMTRSSGLPTAGDLPAVELLADASRWFARCGCASGFVPCPLRAMATCCACWSPIRRIASSSTSWASCSASASTR